MSNNYGNYPIHQKLLPSKTYNNSSSLQNVRLSQNNNISKSTRIGTYRNSYNQIKTPSTNNNITRKINKNEPMENLDPTSKAFYYVWLIFGILVIAMMGYNSYLMKDFSENADNYTTKEVISMTKKMQLLKLGTFISFTLSLGSLLAYVAYSSIRSDHHNSLKTIRPFAIFIVVFYGLIYLYGIAIQLINMFKNDLSLVFTLYEIYIGLIGIIILIKLIKAFVMNRTIRSVKKEKTRSNYYQGMDEDTILRGNSKYEGMGNKKPNMRQNGQIQRPRQRQIQGNQRNSNKNMVSNPLGVTGMTSQSLNEPRTIRRNQMVPPY